ncbi:protein of unknown function [Streptomyces murinus]|uniref:hypothetical protein n=1 Tax=Streptomyces murinus TaxID=33900 RepID=UPI003D666ECB
MDTRAAAQLGRSADGLAIVADRILLARNHMAHTPDRKHPRPAAQPSGAATHNR